MIVRIATEGQYRVGESDVPALNELDNAAAEACQAGDEARFRESYKRLIELVRDATMVQGRLLHGVVLGIAEPEVEGSRYRRLSRGSQSGIAAVFS